MTGVLAERARGLYAFDAWAMGRLLEAVGALASPPTKALSRIGHIVAAQEIWLHRLGSYARPTAVFPEGPALAESRERWEAVRAAWTERLSRVTDAELGSWMEYVSLEGVRYRSRVEDVVTHVVVHGAYHRGQVATDCAGMFASPMLTDYIAMTRERAG